MMRVVQSLTALVALALLPISAFADEPPPVAGPVRANAAVGREVVRGYEYRPELVPACFDQFGAILLECAPRVYVPPRDIATLNALHALPSRVTKPYPYLFSW